MSQDEVRDNESLERKRPTDDGSPITVGGGGGKKPKEKDRDNVSCRFKDGDYPVKGKPSNGRHPHRHKDHGKIKTFLIRKRGEWRDLSDLLPPNGNCQIVISCEGDNDDVIINGNEFGIDMNPDTYQDLGYGVHTNPNAASFINGVVLNDGQKLHNLGPFDEDDDCKVCTDFVDPNHSHCPSDPVITPGLESTEETKTELRKDPPDDGSPITVGGGGGIENEGEDRTVGKNKCTFLEADYPDPEVGNPKKKVFKHSDWQIKTFKIYTATGFDDYSGYLPLTGECEIEVRSKSNNDDVTIISRKVGAQMEFGIDMDTRAFKDKPHATVHENPDGDSYVYEVELRGKRFKYIWGEFVKDDGCWVCTDYIKNSRKCPS